MKTFLTICILCSLSTICSAQRTKKENALSIERGVPLYIRPPYIPNKCSVDELLVLLRDSLAREGFTIIDSARASSNYRSFIKEIPNILQSKQGESPEVIKARLDMVMQTKKIHQEITVQNNSCFDTLHNYTITVLVFPRPKEEKKSISFTLPFDSPYRISDVILSLIERKPPKK